MLLIKIFKDYLYFVEINRAKGTYNAEKDAIARFKRFMKLKNITSSEEITKDLLIEFVKFCKSNNNCNKTINKSIASVRRSFNYSKIENEDLFEYGNLIEEKKHYNFLSDFKINKLLSYLKELPDNELNTRIKLMIMLLLDTGARISELLDIRFKYIGIKTNSILLIHTKKHRQRYVFFTDSTKKILLNYIKCYCDVKNNYLFFNNERKAKIVYNTIKNYFHKIKKECNFKEFSPHVLRHTNGTVLASGGLNEFDLKALLGHSSVTTTQIYVHNNKKMLANKFKQAFKKGNCDNNYDK